MPNLSDKELSALDDQLAFEKVMCCKYRTAVQECQDQELKTCFQRYADQHKQNYDCLLTYLN